MKTPLVRNAASAIIVGCCLSLTWLTLIVLPIALYQYFYVSSSGIPDGLHNYAWKVYLTPLELMRWTPTISSVDPLITLIPSFALLFVLWSVVLSAIVFCFRWLMSVKTQTLGVALALMILVGCTEPTTDKWLGQWNGPEGTFLQLEGRNGKYEITIQDLDGPKTYQGTSVGDQIQFERNGATETIRATNGAETGMKWLSEKSNCLTIRPGEGYCRD